MYPNICVRDSENKIVYFKGFIRLDRLYSENKHVFEEWEDEVLKKYYHLLTKEDLSTILGKSKYAIWCRATELKLRKIKGGLPIAMVKILKR